MARLHIDNVDTLGVGASRIIAHPQGTKPYVSLILVRSHEGLRAFWNVCQHLPVPLDSGTGGLPPGEDLVCLTHGARFRATDGLCLAGPCSGGRLEEVELHEDHEGLWALV